MLGFLADMFVEVHFVAWLFPFNRVKVSSCVCWAWEWSTKRGNFAIKQCSAKGVITHSKIKLRGRK